MKKLLLFFIPICFLLALGANNSKSDSAESIYGIYIEKETALKTLSDGKTKISQDLALAMADYVVSFGYACSSITRISQTAMSGKFRLRCNYGRYNYEIRDRGGKWVIKAD